MELIEKLVSFFYYYVLFYIIYFFSMIGVFFYKNFIRKRKNIIERYGKNSWALVTGATDGIGKSFCEELCLLGFNIILVSRSEEKLETVSSELKKMNSEIETHTVIFDFAEKTEISDYQSAFEGLKSFDISIIVNNVGYGKVTKFTSESHKTFLDKVNINSTSHVLITKIFLEHLNGRISQSAVINVSSAASDLPLPYFSDYSASKSLMTYFGKGLSGEYRKKIDFLVTKPYGVATNLSEMKADNLFIITPKQCVNGTLDSLGHDIETYGYWSHNFIGNLSSLLTFLVPKSILDVLVLAFFKFYEGLVKQKSKQRQEKTI